MKRKLIEYEPVSGEEIGACWLQAVAICAREECKVVFYHNDHRYSISPDQLFTLMKEENDNGK